MYRFEDQKDLRRAMNGKMIVMMVGVMLIVNAVTSSARMSISAFGIAGQAADGVKEFVDWMAEAGKTVAKMRVVGVVFALTAMVEIFAGVFSVKLSNRLDTSKLCLKITAVLLGVEVLAQLFLIFEGLTMPSMVFSALAFPLMLLWGVVSLRKLAKKYPDRKFAMEPRPARKKEVQPQKKNLMERAKAQVKDEETASSVVEEISETTEETKVEE